MTDYAKLLRELQCEESKRYPKCSTLTKLISLVDEETEKLPKELYIPEYEVDKKFLFEVLTKLGYNFEFEEEYNSYFEQFCYKIKLKLN